LGKGFELCKTFILFQFARRNSKGGFNTGEALNSPLDIIRSGVDAGIAVFVGAAQPDPRFGKGADKAPCAMFGGVKVTDLVFPLVQGKDIYLFSSRSFTVRAVSSSGAIYLRL
jgi:hypothetical protein